MKFRAIEPSDLELIRKWRQGKGYMLRTETDITEYSQNKWYQNSVSDRGNQMKFWGIEDKKLVGYCTLDVDYVNGRGELGLLIGDEYQRKGYGTVATDWLINKSFNDFRLHSVFYECYDCNPAHIFWDKVGVKYKANVVMLPATKFYNGTYFNSFLGTIINEK
jgi:RimJ/RimL family protein N-acetyltransferase